ncbi:hypothetical protein E2I00_015950, partial [Balaenoptera physalus]
PCFLKDWEMHVHFKVHGAGKKNLHGDGIALWYTRDRLVPGRVALAQVSMGQLQFLPLQEHLLLIPGPVFGSKDNFHGLAIFLDTYPNDETTENEWKNCIDITGVRLPTGYYFGASAGTGDLSGNLATLCGGGGGRWAMCAEAAPGPLEANSHPSDNHDIISMKLFQLMVEHTPDEENIDWTKIEPSVNLLKSPKDNVDDPTGNFRSGPLTGWRVFLLLLCALLGIIVCAVVGAVVFQKRQERNK